MQWSTHTKEHDSRRPVRKMKEFVWQGGGCERIGGKDMLKVQFNWSKYILYLDEIMKD